MSYATRERMVAMFGEAALVDLTNPDDPQAAVINDLVLNRAMADGDATVDGYIASQVATPMVNPPPIIPKIACDLTIYELAGPRPTDRMIKCREDGISWLKDVGRGAIRPFALPSADGSPTSPPNSVLSIARQQGDFPLPTTGSGYFGNGGW